MSPIPDRLDLPFPAMPIIKEVHQDTTFKMTSTMNMNEQTLLTSKLTLVFPLQMPHMYTQHALSAIATPMGGMPCHSDLHVSAKQAL